MFEEDLAERVDSLFCEISGGGIGPYQDMDTISMLLTGWVIFIFISVAVVKYLYIRFVKKSSFLEIESTENQVEISYDNKETLEQNNETSSSQQNGSPSKRIVETISGCKVVSNSKGPQAPARRRRLDKGHIGEILDEVAFLHNGPCTGSDPDVVEFINKSYEWAFTYTGTQKRSWEDITESIINSLNKTLRDEDLKNDLAITVVDFKLKDEMKLTNIFAECIHANNVKVTSDCELQVTGELTIASKENGLKRCSFFVDRLCGRLSTLFDCEEKSAIIKLDGWPEVCVGISGNSPSKSILDPKLIEAIADRMTSAIRNTIVEIDYSHFEDFPIAAKCSPKKHSMKDEDTKKYLLIKVVRGRELGVLKGCQDPFCAVELDDPPQKFQTDPVHSQDPVWNENFVLNVLPEGGEILFEVYDKVGTRFLGCNIISVEEVRSEKTRTLPLKSRRMEISDQISGSIEAQFTLLGEKEFLQRKSDMAEKISANGNLVKTTRSVFTRSPDAKSSTFAENVIKELERNTLPNPNKSTLIIHAVQRDANSPIKSLNSTYSSRPIVKIEKLSDGTYSEVSEDSSLRRKERLKKEEVSTGIEGQYGDERGRGKTRKGDIFTSIRRRFSKGRSQSVVTTGGGEGAENENSAENSENLFQRSVSADRQSMLSTRMGLGSARSSTSELSGISGFSTSTFVHENSTLVVECIENRIRKYYLVPPNLAESGKWKKKGKKLHIYNDHTFVAKHLPSGTMCEICTQRLPFSLGKQGYQCRDCKMKCHKECHIRAPSFCPKTTIYDIELSTAKRLDESKSQSSVFSNFFCGKKETGSVGLTNQNNSLPTNETNNLNAKNHGKSKKKKSNIFRKVTKLGKISEENLASKERLNGGLLKPPHDISEIIESTEPTEIKIDEKTTQNITNSSSPTKQNEEEKTSENTETKHEQVVEAETHENPTQQEGQKSQISNEKGDCETSKEDKEAPPPETSSNDNVKT